MATDERAGWLGERDPYQTMVEELLTEAVVDDLRFAFVYGSDSVDIRYLREDLLSEDMLPRVSELRERARDIDGWPSTETEEIYGDTELVIVYRERGVEIHFVGGDDTGLIAMADRTEEVVEQLLSA